MTRKNPYQMLLEEFREYANKVEYRHRKNMWTYPKEKLLENWRLDDLKQRIEAAEQLGYSVELLSTPAGIVVQYVKNIPSRPWRVS
jgi:hypothetical protein